MYATVDARFHETYFPFRTTNQQDVRIQVTVDIHLRMKLTY